MKNLSNNSIFIEIVRMIHNRELCIRLDAPKFMIEKLIHIIWPDDTIKYDSDVQYLSQASNCNGGYYIYHFDRTNIPTLPPISAESVYCAYMRSCDVQLETYIQEFQTLQF